MTTFLVAKSTRTFTRRSCVQTKYNSSSLFYLVVYLTTLSVIQMAWIKKGRLGWNHRGNLEYYSGIYPDGPRAPRELSPPLMYALRVASLGGWTAVLQRSILLRLGYDTVPSIPALSCFLFFLMIVSFSLLPWHTSYFLLLSLSVSLLLSTASSFLSLCASLYSFLPSWLFFLHYFSVSRLYFSFIFCLNLFFFAYSTFTIHIQQSPLQFVRSQKWVHLTGVNVSLCSTMKRRRSSDIREGALE